MTLRLDDEQDAILTELARLEGASKNEVAIRAILDRYRRTQRSREIREATDDIVERYGPLLDRLAQ